MTGLAIRRATAHDAEDSFARFPTHEVTEIAFDEQFAPETFVFTPPPGEVVRVLVSVRTVA